MNDKHKKISKNSKQKPFGILAIRSERKRFSSLESHLGKTSEHTHQPQYNLN